MCCHSVGCGTASLNATQQRNRICAALQPVTLMLRSAEKPAACLREISLALFPSQRRHRIHVSGAAGREKRSVRRGQTLLDGEENTGSLAFTHHAHDVISGPELLSIHCFVQVVLVLPWSKITAGVEPGTGSFFAFTMLTFTMIMPLCDSTASSASATTGFSIFAKGVPSFAA